jgi:hypothetical protein
MSEERRAGGPQSVSPPLPKPDSVQTIPPLHPATVKMLRALVRTAKGAIGILESYIEERQQ